MIGTGILKGMAVTARNFVGSYFEKERLITVQYPEERIPLPENYRNFPILIYDNDPQAGLRCVACKICEKECPPQCIYIVKSDDKKPDYMGKTQFYPRVSDIDISVCMSSQICDEYCQFEDVKMNKVFGRCIAERLKPEDEQTKRDYEDNNFVYQPHRPDVLARSDDGVPDHCRRSRRNGSKRNAARAVRV